MVPEPRVKKYHLHKIKRLSGRRPRMTFVVAFHCFNGLVFCADSEENDGVNKKYVEKLYPRILSGEIGVCFGGAGDAVGIEKFKSKVFPVLDSITPVDQIGIELNVEKVLEHVENMYQLDFQIALGGFNINSSEIFLYRTHERSHVLQAIDEGEFVAIGMDTSLAHFVLTATFDPFMGVKEALRLGIWITALSKIHASGVGGPTLAFSYKKQSQDGWERHLSSEIEEIENTMPASELRETLSAYWKSKNPDIWETINGARVRPVDY